MEIGDQAVECAVVRPSNRKSRVLGVALLGAVIIALPHFLSVYYLSMFGLFLVGTLFALSFNLLFGYMGYLSFGQAVFFGLGAYTIALLNGKAGINFFAALPFSIMVALAGAFVIGFFCVRLARWYFAILTLAFGQVFYMVAVKWRAFTGGDDGITQMTMPGILASATNYYYFTLILVALGAWVIWRIINSPFGNTLRAIRENPTRARAIGVDEFKHKLVAFIIAGGLTGLAGALSYPLSGIVAPAHLDWAKSSEPVMMTLLGGQYSFAGPIVGAAIYTFLQFYIGTKTIYWGLAIGLAMVVVVLFLRGGIVGFVGRRVLRQKD